MAELDVLMDIYAQELQALMPELVVTEDVDRDPETGEVTRKTAEYLGVKYMELIPVLIKALQEEHAKVEALEERMSNLESQISE